MLPQGFPRNQGELPVSSSTWEVPLAKGNQRRTGRMAEQSYEPILPAKVGNRRARAATLATIPAGENPVGGDCLVATVVISGSGKGDRTTESLDVKVSVREASNSAGCSKGEPVSPEIVRRWECRAVGSPRRRPVLVAKELGACSDKFPGDSGGDMLRRNRQQKRGTTRGSPRRSRTAKASHIRRSATKLRCAREWGGWGRLSDDGPRQNNSDRSECPWGRPT
jgi:hypothetical protein